MEQLIQAHPDIVGVFDANAVIAAGIIEALTKGGKSVLRNVGMMGSDNTRWAEYSHPRLSTVAQPATAPGERLANFVIRQLNGEDLAVEEARWVPAH